MKQSTTELPSRPSRVALFDFDGTICRINSYHAYLHWILDQKNLFSLKTAFALAARRFRLITSKTLKNFVLKKLKGMSMAEVKAFGEELYETRIKPELRTAALEELGKKRSEGYRIVVVSGAFDFLLGPFCRTHSIDCYRCTEIEYKDGLCTGRLSTGEMLGEEKLRWIKTFFANEAINWEESCAYSDCETDCPLFLQVGNPYFITSRNLVPSSLPPRIICLKWN